MGMIVVVTVIVVAMCMIMRMVMRMAMRMTHQCPTAIGTALGLKRLQHILHDQVHGIQHLGQHMIGFELEVIGLELQRHMAIAQVVGTAQQIKG